jgi:hypothetical protein
VLSAPRTFAQVARMGRIARQGRTIDAMVSDPARTGVVAVARPEEMPVNETLALEDALRDEVGLEDDSPEVRAARHAHARAAAQRAQLERLRRGVRARVATLPFVFDGDRLARLARELERVL